MGNNRRDFIKKSALSGIGLMGLSLSSQELLAQTGSKGQNLTGKKKGQLQIELSLIDEIF